MAEQKDEKYVGPRTVELSYHWPCYVLHVFLIKSVSVDSFL